METVNIGISEESLNLANVSTKIEYDKEYAKDYLKRHNYFKDRTLVRFEAVENKQIPLRVGNGVSDISGVSIDDNEYAIHLLDCYKEKEACAFRINGIPTGWIGKEGSEQVPKKQRSFKLNNDYQLVIKSIQFDYCDKRRFCDYFYESYDLVELSIQKDEEPWWRIW